MKGVLFDMWFIIIGVIFFIESIILTVVGIKKKQSMMTYLGVVIMIMTVGMILVTLNPPNS
ncbi:hypothetical protein BsIDN1_14300 [Bacillus safensis]|uniref:Uncharacterized protein n=2 Tax=Bacillaceae TaxID=186817 RepID=A0A5C0WFG4_BACIA|nr:hypothetical protein FX981_00788 [Bacillus safensis]TDU10868.1 hypothetical protein EV579_3338 [Bacillus sp. BK450]WBL30451.1 hypothetical protein ORQ91_03046 [Bacillus safensis]BBP87812.1 hypothetical protein BsIDN1_14300 [Bacillus safensis]VCT97800.1 hypothetical protein AIDNDMCJ_11885 [Bacillus safensis]